jgi:hypothetical protein
VPAAANFKESGRPGKVGTLVKGLVQVSSNKEGKTNLSSQVFPKSNCVANSEISTKITP